MAIARPHSPKHIGIVGGMGPFATQRFIRHVLEYARDAYGARLDEDYPRMTLESLSVPLLTAQGLAAEGTRTAIPLLTEALSHLEQSGAKVIGIPCNTIHAVFGELEKVIAVPLLSIIETTAQAAVLQKSQTAYILATGSTISESLYQNALQEHGIFSLVPELSIQKKVEMLITILEGGSLTTEAHSLYSEILEDVRTQGADSVILGCTELSYLLPLSSEIIETQMNTEDFKIIDSSRALAEALVTFAYSTE
jgi:aspartate racemase